MFENFPAAILERKSTELLLTLDIFPALGNPTALISYCYRVVAAPALVIFVAAMAAASDSSYYGIFGAIVHFHTNTLLAAAILLRMHAYLVQ